MGDCWAFWSHPRAPSHLWCDAPLRVPEKHHPQLLCDACESRSDARGRKLAHGEAASSHGRFLADPAIALPYSCHAMTRSWSLPGFAAESARLFVGATLASPSSLFHIDDHPDHAHPESGPRCENLAHRAFSSTVSGNVRILEEIRQFGIISKYLSICFFIALS